jgi:uncharacterized protein GlcG (DUF336 family)
MKRMITALAATLAPSLAMAQPTPPPTPPAPPPAPAAAIAIALAVEAAQTAIGACSANGYRVTAVVVDAAGSPRLVMAGDGAGARTVEIGTRKAFTAVTLNRPTAQVAEQIRTDAALAGRVQVDTRMIPWAGGQPLHNAAGAIVGGIGVSGAPGGDKDDACATAAVARIQDRLR